MEPDQLVDVQFKLCTPRMNHLISLINAWSRGSVHYDRGPVQTLSLRWRPGDVHPLVVENPGAGAGGGDDYGNEGGDDHGNEGGEDENLPGDDDIPPVAGVVSGNPRPGVGVVEGNILPGVVDDVVKADAVSMSADDGHDCDDDLPAAAAGKQRKRKISTDEKNEKRQRRESCEYRTEEEGLISN